MALAARAAYEARLDHIPIFSICASSLGIAGELIDGLRVAEKLLQMDVAVEGFGWLVRMADFAGPEAAVKSGEIGDGCAGVEGCLSGVGG